MQNARAPAETSVRPAAGPGEAREWPHCPRLARSGPARPGPSTSRHAVPWSRGVPGPSPRSSGAQTDPPGPRPLLTLHVCTCACSMRDRGPRVKFHAGVGLSNV